MMSAMRLVIGCKYHADDCVEMILYGEDDNNSVTSVFHRGIDAFLRKVRNLPLQMTVDLLEILC